MSPSKKPKSYAPSDVDLSADVEILEAANTAAAAAAAAAFGAAPATRLQSLSPPSTTRSPPPTTLLPGDHWRQTELEPFDGDSALGSEVGSERGSLTESVLAYRHINGRQYHADRGSALHWSPNDRRHIESAELHYYVINDWMGGPYRAPIEPGKVERVLDVGTGLGLWAIDFADLFPDAEVIGTDISPIQPTWVPQNVRFEIEDCTQPWPYPDEWFDYIHIRCLYGSIPDWDFIYDEAMRVLKPGGWIEHLEWTTGIHCDDPALPATSAISQWEHFFLEGGDKLGRTFRVVQDRIQDKQFDRCGLTDVVVCHENIPIGGWPEDERQRFIGRGAWMALDEDMEGYLGLMASLVAGWTQDQVDAFCAHIRREVLGGKWKTYYTHRLLYGRKPE